MKETDKTYRFIISGGGTGGHIYPAIAIAQALQQLAKVEILFVGALGKMEMNKIPEAGFEIVGLPIMGIQRRLTIKNILFPFKLISSILLAFRIIKNFKPDVVIGVGGYASGAVLYAATKKQIPTLIQEQNGYAGLTNKLLAPKVDRICVAYEGMERFFPKNKLVITGNPVRTDIIDLSGKEEMALRHFDLRPGVPTLLVIGGSLGARTINESVIASLKKLNQLQVQVMWQTGGFYFEEMINRTKQLELSNIKVMKFIKEMDLAYAVADVVISRSGALSISELCLAGKSVVLVPSPTVADDHQTKNAMALVEKDAAVLVNDDEAKEKLIDTAWELMQDRQRRNSLENTIVKLAKPNAARDIALEALQLTSSN